MRRGGYLKIARRQLNPRRRCRCCNPERYRRRIALLPPRIYCPDCQPVVPQRQLCEAVSLVSVVRAVLTADRSRPSSAATVRRSRKLTPFHHLRRVPAGQHLVFPLSAVTSAVRLLHRWRRDTIHRAALVAVKSAPRYPRWLLFPVHAARRWMAYVPSSFSRILTQRNTALAQRRQLQPPHAVFSNASQEHGSLSPSRRR